MFAHRLALALGRTVSELDNTLSSSEFVEWMAYYTIEPWGQWRDNWHSAQIAALLYNVNSSKKQLTTNDFMYHDQESAQEKQDFEFLSRLDSVAKREK